MKHHFIKSKEASFHLRRGISEPQDVKYMNVDYKKYHRDQDYAENEGLFKNIFTKRFFIASKFKKTPGKVLDIGTSTGTMLDVFKEAGWETWGVEPSESSVVAKEKGHKITRGFFEDASLPKNYFDLVIMNHVLEHVKDPVMIMKKIYSLLKKGGLVYIDVPNAGGVSSKVLGDHWPYKLPEEHLQQFTRQNLSEVFKKANFEVIHFESRSGLFEFAYPFSELFLSLTTFKKRFFRSILTFPYDLVVTLINSGDSMSMIGRK